MIAIVTRFNEVVVEFSLPEEREHIEDFIKALLRELPASTDYCKECGAPASLQSPNHVPPTIEDDDIPF